MILCFTFSHLLQRVFQTLQHLLEETSKLLTYTTNLAWVDFRLQKIILCSVDFLDGLPTPATSTHGFYLSKSSLPILFHSSWFSLSRSWLFSSSFLSIFCKKSSFFNPCWSFTCTWIWLFFSHSLSFSFPVPLRWSMLDGLGFQPPE